MDFLSLILAAIGWQKNHANKVSDRRIEAYRMNAEVAAEAAQCANMLALATPSILRRAALLFPDQPLVYQSCHDTLTTMRAQAEQLHAMAESYKPMIERGSTWADWDKAVRQLHEWRSTASMLRPHTETIIKRYEDLLTAAENTEPLPSPSPPVRQPRDRGWDAPPL
ncbi:hypothetical protein [Rhizobium sp. LC145]|uniref:hypothetical protein n=1 Tax=Rhizobium sp. LC145 TaxID=1120688 RepID=UPI00062A4EC3|nr:hypothetical protein [Rhizobium sp. LC145]KKX34291.1 hypothetical protein YH62_03810 [Rhizobium sp. LC145]TKT46025.1 hypothetical protein FDR95_24650 [Rhizobiaceae bacterium LC148]